MKYILTILFLTLSTTCFADCIGTITDVIVDSERGTIQVIGSYELNGEVVHTGTIGRYDEDSAATVNDLKLMIRDNTKEHCAALILRIPENALFRHVKRKETQESKIATILNNLKTDLIGQSVTVNKYEEQYKDKIISVYADGTTSITDAP